MSAATRREEDANKPAGPVASPTVMAHLAALDDAFEAWWMDEGADMTPPYTTRRNLARLAFLRGVQAGRRVVP